MCSLVVLEGHPDGFLQFIIEVVVIIVYVAFPSSSHEIGSSLRIAVQSLILLVREEV